MKRILLSVFAAALTAAWAVPASAADVTFGGQYRLRGEYRENTDFNDDIPDATDMWGQRVRLTANANATDDTSVKITIQDTRTWGTDGNSTDSGTNNLDLHESYVNIKNIFGSPVTFRAGRQELAYGGERLISPGDWSNNARSFDAFKFMYSNDGVKVDAFTSTITEDSTAVNEDASFSGVYATLTKLVPNNTLDVYLLHQDNVSLDGTRFTLGARLAGAVNAFDYSVEVPYQFGELSDTVDIAAWAATVTAGYTLPAVPLRIGAGIDYASGDDSSTGDENEAFNSLYATTHGVLGYGDVTGANTWSDIFSWNVNATYKLNDKTSLYAAYWSYKEDEVAAGADDDIGSEIDLHVAYKYNNNVGLLFQVAHFMPGDALSTSDDPQDWAALQLTANF